jgi:hypothetical protein
VHDLVEIISMEPRNLWECLYLSDAAQMVLDPTTLDLMLAVASSGNIQLVALIVTHFADWEVELSVLKKPRRGSTGEFERKDLVFQVIRPLLIPRGTMFVSASLFLLLSSCRLLCFTCCR